MTLEAIYYIGQTIAVVAILASLIAIFWQQKHANKIARVQNLEGLTTAYADSLRDIMNSDELATIFRKVMFEDQSLTPVETTRIMFYFNIMLTGHQKAWSAFENGLYDAQGLKIVDANTAWYLTKPIFLYEWKRARRTDLYSGSFGDHIEGLISAKPSDASFDGVQTVSQNDEGGNP